MYLSGIIVKEQRILEPESPPCEARADDLPLRLPRRKLPAAQKPTVVAQCINVGVLVAQGCAVLGPRLPVNFGEELSQLYFLQSLLYRTDVTSGADDALDACIAKLAKNRGKELHPLLTTKHR
eukprot:CAMPEP_0194482332 /NCGR_PEP_ID=MMETSP0253-20130528/4338_1 /TAXON_ID=2966 /ORGANISM="Noctiluca scintillans" /LENGTH=122 /DNA_ID=CAMNT_0039321869 /DNA_START=115 /DNA_END=483 /DNA_ORIENTATION=-